MQKLMYILFFFLFSTQVYAQGDSCKVIQVLGKQYSDTTSLNSSYQEKGIVLVQNGIYDFKIDGKNYYAYRILAINGDTISLAWAMQRWISVKTTVDKINKVMLPLLENGELQRSKLEMSKRKYTFSIVCRSLYKHTISKVCENDECSIYIRAYLYLTANEGWKPVYEFDGITYMRDGTARRELYRR